MLLPIGAIVRCRDGAAGRLKFVVVDPDDGAVTHLIVERGLLLRRDIVVPVAWVESSSEDEIVLNATAEELNELPEYLEVEFVEPDPNYRPLLGHQVQETRIWVSPYMSIPAGKPWILRKVRMGVQDDEVVLRRGLPVQTRDGRRAGAIDHLVVDEGTKRVTHLVVRRGWLWDQEARTVPLERVAEASEYGVRLNMTAEELDQAPTYQAPASDAEITAGLQRAMETDLRTRDAGLRAEIQGGVVRFVDEATKEVLDAARDIARRLRGVIGFADDVAAPPAPPLRIGAPVNARDGRYGTLDKVVIDPYTRRVTHMVIRKGWLLTEDRVIPIERVVRVGPDGINLDATSEELNQYPLYHEDIFVEPLEGWEEVAPYAAAETLFWGGAYVGVPPPILPAVEHVVPANVPEGEIVLRRGVDVFANDALVGSLDHVLFDPSNGLLTHLVVEERTTGRRVIAPAEWVSGIKREAVVLSRWNPHALGVPAYEVKRDDAAIYGDVKLRLSADPVLSEIQVRVDHCVVYLFGIVPTIAEKAAADAIVRGVPGVIDVENALSTDTALFGRVSAELAADPRTALIPIDVVVARGIVTLKGDVPSPKIKQVAEQIARSVPDVITVINELEIRRREPEPALFAWTPPH